MRRLVVTLLVALGAIAIARAEASPPFALHVRHVLLVSIDGLRPDLLLRGDTPTLRGLMRRGTFTMWAQTTAVAVTLPSHVSMLTGVRPTRHGIEWNWDVPLAKTVRPQVPTLFTLAHKAGLTTALVAGKVKFGVLFEPGVLDWSYLPDSTVSDSVVTAKATRILAEHAPDVAFVHLPQVDTEGHAEGWGSPAQMRAIGYADACVGRLLGAIRSRGLLDSTLVIVTSDHGGAGKSHGADDPRSRHIPWIAVGPGVPRDLDLTTDADLVVRTEDTFATLCAALGLVAPEPLDGHPVKVVVGHTGS